MLIVTGDYKCTICGGYFNWDNNSSYYGLPEYKTINDGPEAYFCSDKCALKFKPIK